MNGTLSKLLQISTNHLDEKILEKPRVSVYSAFFVSTPQKICFSGA